MICETPASTIVRPTEPERANHRDGERYVAERERANFCMKCFHKLSAL